MIYKKYGSTGIDVSAIGFGGMRFENKNGIDNCASLVKAAYDKGINYFDTASGYDKSEEIFGAAFKEMNRTRAQKPFYVSTKTTGSKPEEIRKDIETSLKRMDLNYIDFYHVWCILSLDEYRSRKADGALAELERLKAEGLVKHICVSTHLTGPDIDLMLRDYPFDGVLVGYCAMNFACREAGLEAAANLNRGVVIMNPLGGGIIPQNPDRFSFVKTRDTESVVEAALRFLINDPRITIALVGLSSTEQLNEAISAVDGYESIPPAAIQKIRDSLSRSFNELCTNCFYCDGCPQDIPVQKMMDAYNNYVLTGKTIDMVNHLKWHWGIDLENNPLDRCTQCGQCEEACTQKLPICQRFKFISAEITKFLASNQTKE